MFVLERNYSCKISGQKFLLCSTQLYRSFLRGFDISSFLFGGNGCRCRPWGVRGQGNKTGGVIVRNEAPFSLFAAVLMAPQRLFPLFFALWNSNTKEEKRALAGEREEEGEEKNLLLYYGWRKRRRGTWYWNYPLLTILFWKLSFPPILNTTQFPKKL